MRRRDFITLIGGAPFGGFKQSGIGREECFEEMLAYTQEKNIHVRLKPAKP
jgi:betaine-aldehyde dehydrogenase